MKKEKLKEFQLNPHYEVELKPNTDVKGKHQVIKGNDVFFYWDLNAEPNANGNKWRQATNPLNLMVDKAQKWLFNTIGEVENE